MDWAPTQNDHIDRSLAKRHLAEGGSALSDVASTRFARRTSPLAALRNEKGSKPGRLVASLSPMCDATGRPIGVEVFKVNISDHPTLSPEMDRMRTRFGPKQVVAAGGRALLTPACIREGLRKLVATEPIQLSLLEPRDLTVITAPEYPGEPPTVCRNPLLAGARELASIAEATRRERRPLCAKDQIGLRVG